MFDESRLETLASAYFDRQLDAAERRELETMLLGSARARQRFLGIAECHGLAAEWARGSRSGDLMGARPRPNRRAPARRYAWLGAGLAACAMFAWLFLFPGETEDTPGTARTEESAGSTPDEVALLAQAIDVRWEGEPRRVGTALPKGRLAIREGTLRLDFYSGARVILEGPASLDLMSQDLARLHEGRLTARVPPPAEGFTVLNADMRVVDRGTEFGMSATKDDCEVHVFDGEVELQGELPATTARALFGGEAVSIRRDSSRAFAANRGVFADPAGMLRAVARESAARYRSWHERSERLRGTPGLRIYYDFEDLDSGGMTLENRAAGASEDTDGSIVGCETLAGRWPSKPALGFARTSDRVRFRAEGEVSSMTLVASVRVDSLPLDHNSLLSMSPELVGEVHWKLDRSGRLLLGLRASEELAFDSWERLVSPRIISGEDFGRWMHLATVIDGENRVMKHYVNGREVASAPMTRETPVRLGRANLGNFDPASPDGRSEPNYVRSFNGRIDEFALFTRALDAGEIAALQ